MRKNEGIVVSVRLPKAVVQYIDDQVDTGMFTSRSDCIQQILREWIRYPRGGGEIRLTQVFGGAYAPNHTCFLPYVP